MPANHDISRAFSLYAELLRLHGKDERLADLLSGAAYRIRRMDQAIDSMKANELAGLFRTPIVTVIRELAKSGTIEAMQELVQLTPAGLFDMMRIKGLGGKKLAVLWKIAKIDNVEDLLQVCKENKLAGIPGFGKKTEDNIIAAVEALNSQADRFHYADVADIADQLVAGLQRHFKTELVSLCGEVRRQSTTVDIIEIITTVSANKLAGAKRLLVSIKLQRK